MTYTEHQPGTGTKAEASKGLLAVATRRARENLEAASSGAGSDQELGAEGPLRGWLDSESARWFIYALQLHRLPVGTAAAERLRHRVAERRCAVRARAGNP